MNVVKVYSSIVSILGHLSMICFYCEFMPYFQARQRCGPQLPLGGSSHESEQKNPKIRKIRKIRKVRKSQKVGYPTDWSVTQIACNCGSTWCSS